MNVINARVTIKILVDLDNVLPAAHYDDPTGTAYTTNTNIAVNS